MAAPASSVGLSSLSRALTAVTAAASGVLGLLLFLGACVDGRDPETAPSNHSPHAAFDDRVLPDGAALYAELAMRWLDDATGDDTA